MAEVKNYTFSHAELAEILIKRLDIHEGIWGLSIEFSFTATNMPVAPDFTTMFPASISFINKIGVQRFEVPSNLTVDAAKVNPTQGHSKRKVR